MKLLVFAHTPPPHHGQSYMVHLMLAGLGGDRRHGPGADGAGLGIECYHVNARLSKKLEDIGNFHFGKLMLLLGYCLEAIWCRFRYGVTTLYYIPAPGKRSALYRDWVVMLLCRPFFKRVILHWHAAGLAKWLETVVQMRKRSFTYRMLKQVDLSIVLSHHNRADAEKLFSRRIQVVGNGIPDPCPDFEARMLPRRKARLAARRKLLAGQPLSAADREHTGGDPQLFRVAFLAHCTREKGLFDTLNAVALANERLRQAGAPIRLHLTVAGEFIKEAEHRVFQERIAQPDLQLPQGFAGASRAAVTYAGFVAGAAKERVLAESDCFCFPTYYYAESFGLVIIEAMAFGSPVVATRWRSIPELLPSDYPGLVDIKQPAQVAEALVNLLDHDNGEELRALYLRRFSLEQHLKALAAAFHSLEPKPQPKPAPRVRQPELVGAGR
jgi:glycosyltransferase involved in cell wall biosynthesis